MVSKSVLLLWFCLAVLASAQTPGAGPGAGNFRERAKAFPGTAPAVDYRLGANDLVSIVVYDFPDLSREVRISEDGSISLPLLPEPIQAGGRTRKELEQAIARALEERGMVNAPQVTVFIREYRARVVSVVGAVRAPMAYNLMGPTPLLEVISRAGGLTDDAAEEITLTAGGVYHKIPVRELLQGEAAANPLLEGGEVVHVPRAGIVYVVGAVRRPGGFVLRSQQPLTVVKALALAEDLKNTAARDKAVIIRSPVGRPKQEIPLKLKQILARKAEDPLLEANDVLFVPDSSGKKAILRGLESAIGIGSGLVIYRGW